MIRLKRTGFILRKQNLNITPMTLTAIDQLVLDLISNGMLRGVEFVPLVEKAKQLEKQQIIEARSTAPLLLNSLKEDYKVEAEGYYNKKFKK
jgi:hypothetical protein